MAVSSTPWRFGIAGQLEFTDFCGYADFQTQYKLTGASMKINNLLIHLHNSVDAFSLKPRHVDLISGLLPDTQITVADGNRDFLEKLPEADCVLAWAFKSDWYQGAPKLKAVFTPAAPGMTGSPKTRPGVSGPTTAHFTAASCAKACSR